MENDHESSAGSSTVTKQYHTVGHQKNRNLISEQAGISFQPTAPLKLFLLYVILNDRFGAERICLKAKQNIQNMFVSKLRQKKNQTLSFQLLRAALGSSNGFS